jgi:putative transposase
METHQEEFRVTTMCRVLRASRSGYYYWLKGLESQRVREDRKLRVEIRAVYRRSRSRYGSPRVYRALQQQGVRCGENRVARLMKEEKLQARRDRRFKVTTRSVPSRRVASNRLNQEFSVPHLDTVWAGDITYLWTREGWLYLAVLLDLCSRRVVGWSCSDRLSSPLVESALEKALQQRRPAPGLLHHSDQGGQFFQHVEGGVGRLRPLRDPSAGADRVVRVHRGVLQPAAPAFLARIPEPGRI